jgi:hypothetical protein
MAKMKRIGTVENNFHIYQKKLGSYMVVFLTENHSVSLINFEWCDFMSEETLAFKADLVIDGVIVGECRNDGHGGCANYYGYNNWDLTNKAEEEISAMEDYCFPKMKLSLSDVIDKIANLMVTLITSKIRSNVMALCVIEQIQKQADYYRNKYSK